MPAEVMSVAARRDLVRLPPMDGFGYYSYATADRQFGTASIPARSTSSATSAYIRD